MRDDRDQSPLDWVLLHPNCLKAPSSSLSSTAASNNVYMQFLRASIGSSSPSVLESKMIVHKFARLPSWLRRQACGCSTVQRVIVEELTNPFVTALILLSGCILIALITFFRIMMDEYMESVRGNVTTLTEWYGITTFALGVSHMGFQLFIWMGNLYIDEVFNQCVTSYWRWMDIIAGGLVLLSTTAVAREKPQLAVLERHR